MTTRRVRMVVDGKVVRRVADEDRQRIYTRGTPYERALARVTVDEAGCWIWNGARTSGGYGHINVGAGKNRHAHIVTFEHHHGPVPDGLQLDHLCRNRACVNPEHLEPVTPQENTRRGMASVRRCAHPEAELYRSKTTGSIKYCRACRRERRRRAS